MRGNACVLKAFSCEPDGSNPRHLFGDSPIGPAVCAHIVTPAHLDILLESAHHPPRMSTGTDRDRLELLQGTLDLLILRTLRSGPAHGHAITKIIERGSGDLLQVEQGSLYPALHRLIKRRWITAEEGCPRTTAGRSTTGSQRKGGSSSRRRSASGTSWFRRSPAFCGQLRM